MYVQMEGSAMAEFFRLGWRIFFFGRTEKMAAAFFLVEEPPRVSPGTIMANVSRRQENPA